MKCSIVLTTLLLLGFVGASRCVSETVPLYRYYNAGIGDHFYSTNWSDLEDGRLGYVYEGVAGQVFPAPKEGTLPLYQYYNTGNGDHFYTTNFNELMGGGGDPWTLEKVQCYIYVSPVSGSKPLFRYFNGVEHFYTTNWDELGGGSQGYVMEGIKGYLL